MRQLLAAAVVLMIGTAPGMAQDFMKSAGGSWTVAGLGKSCMAINRSPVEFNYSPFNAMALHQLKTDDLPRLQVFFWPGAFEAGAEVTLVVTPSGKAPVEVAARAETIYHAVSIDPAQEDLLEALTNVPDVQIEAKGVLGTLLFETGPLETVADLMGECISQ